MTTAQSSDPPLYCYNGLFNDKHAGWYSVSNSRTCNDFCFWRQPQEYYDDGNEYNYGYTAADPHQLTETLNGGQWGCLMDAVGDDKTWVNALEIYEDYSTNNATFPHLKCPRGAGQKLRSKGQELANSAWFFSLIILAIIAIIVLEVVVYIWRRRRNGIQMQMQTEKDRQELKEEDGNGEDSLSDAKKAEFNLNQDNEEESATSAGKEISDKGVNQSETERDPKQNEQGSESVPTDSDSTKKQAFIKKCPILPARFKKFTIILGLVILNLSLISFMFICSLSLLEIQQGVDLPFALKSLTPACADAEAMCAAGHVAIDRESTHFKDGQSNENGGAVSAFSYLIASDSQLHWYDGESAYIGRLNYPPPCSSSDSCKDCTEKVGDYVNRQMKQSFENLLLQKKADDSSDSPIPKTLIMNGDLTQYFHRHEYKKYAAFYHDINGLEQFFPSLGNHDYDQGSASYGGDEWIIGPKYCNGRHAVAYFRSAFCNKIPKFDAKDRLTRYDPESLAYSWEEGKYHFINVHYHPLYENAAFNIRNSLEWIELDLRLANEKNLTSVLFVHAVHGMPSSMKSMLLENNVAAIFAGHLHRCFGKKCTYLRTLNTKEVEDRLNATVATNKTFEKAEKCFPASAALCNTNANSNGLFYLSDISADLSLPNRKLWSRVPVQRGKCPGEFISMTVKYWFPFITSKY